MAEFYHHFDITDLSLKADIMASELKDINFEEETNDWRNHVHEHIKDSWLLLTNRERYIVYLIARDAYEDQQ
jgi:hypothetical protein